MGNAMAHYVHNVLFWAGREGLHSWATAQEVAAELYRAHAIQSFDTVFAQATTTDGVELRLALSHACAGKERQCEWVVCDTATIYYDTKSHWRIEHRDGRLERAEVDVSDVLARNLAAYFLYVRGEAPGPITSLRDSQPFVELYDLTFVAAGAIHQVPPMATTVSADRESQYIAINGIDEIVSRFFAEDVLPSKQGVAWAAPGGRAARAEIGRLADVVARMV